MDHYAGIDVSLEASSVCVVDGAGKIVREAKIASEPAALIGWFASLGLDLARIGLEAGPLSQWLYAAMKQAGLAVELLETRHVRTALQTMPVKTDRNDARGIAQLMRLGWFRPVHCKSMAAQETRALLTARKLVQSKLYDIEMSLRGILRGFGLKVGPTTPKRFARRIEELVAGHATLEVIAKALLSAHAALLREFDMFEKRVRAMAREDKRAQADDVGAGRRRDRGADLRFGDRRSVAVFVVEAGRTAFRPDAEKISVRRDGRDRADHQDRRRRRAHGALRSRQRHTDAAGEGLRPQELGDEARQARRHEEGEGGAGAQARRDPASDVGRWNGVRRKASGFGCRWRRRKEEKRKGFGRVETPAFPKRSSLAGTMDEVRPQNAPWLTTTRN